jgi:hypothetical protein
MALKVSIIASEAGVIDYGRVLFSVYFAAGAAGVAVAF